MEARALLSQEVGAEVAQLCQSVPLSADFNLEKSNLRGEGPGGSKRRHLTFRSSSGIHKAEVQECPVTTRAWGGQGAAFSSEPSCSRSRALLLEALSLRSFLQPLCLPFNKLCWVRQGWLLLPGERHLQRYFSPLTLFWSITPNILHSINQYVLGTRDTKNRFR